MVENNCHETWAQDAEFMLMLSKSMTTSIVGVEMIVDVAVIFI